MTTTERPDSTSFLGPSARVRRLRGGRALGVARHRLAAASALVARSTARASTTSRWARARRWCSSTASPAAGRTGSRTSRTWRAVTGWWRSTSPASASPSCRRRKSAFPGTAVSWTPSWARSGSSAQHSSGNSMGGFIAAETAITHASRVSKLVLVSAAGLVRVGNRRLARTRARRPAGPPRDGRGARAQGLPGQAAQAAAQDALRDRALSGADRTRAGVRGRERRRQAGLPRRA